MEAIPARYEILLERYGDELTGLSPADRASAARKLYLGETERLRALVGQRRPPFDPFKILPLREIHSFDWRDTLPPSLLAQLRPDDRGFALLLRPPGRTAAHRPVLSNRQYRERDPRIRLTVAHELGHTYFYDMKRRPPRPLLGGFGMTAEDNESEQKEEWWCFDFARELLYPSKWARRVTTPTRFPTLTEASRLRKVFGVSWDIVFRRQIQDLGLWKDCAAFKLESAPGAVRIVAVWKSASLKSFSLSSWLRSDRDLWAMIESRVIPDTRPITSRSRAGERVEMMSIGKGPGTVVGIVQTTPLLSLTERGAIDSHRNHGGISALDRR